ncbi:PepSY domain-containing protein [Sphingorhabdus sp. SMR4y]|uniref:PepSY domain-containing protein n=1 Tax=Sphingorhabdus sp. SMR4y TaxID=2584094 RepID=UPI000B61FAD4|nr:PepSY domain-containing protein [Sphingorhabdus sp. SMR4y]ASK88393.1 peptidase propeptide and YPEB domain protein [Sphingorhabdus sp. SMR4y]
MRKISRKYTAVAAVLATMMLAQPAYADGDIKCDAGPTKDWKSIKKLKKKAWMEGWELLKTQVEGDCYEVYARTESGQAIEAFFHPVTLKKLVVFRRGTEIYRAPGFKG